MRRGYALLQLLLLALAARALAPEALDPWRGWIVFKQYARDVVELPDPGVSVQVFSDEAAKTTTLAFVRQTVNLCDDGFLEPTGGVICEFRYPLREPPAEWELWSFECPSFGHFVDRVEQHEIVQALFVERPVRSAVYWREV